MIFPTKSTNDERIAISNAMWPIFTGLEQAATLLNTCLEDHFEDYPQKAITESEAEWEMDSSKSDAESSPYPSAA